MIDTGPEMNPVTVLLRHLKRLWSKRPLILPGERDRLLADADRVRHERQAALIRAEKAEERLADAQQDDQGHMEEYRLMCDRLTTYGQHWGTCDFRRDPNLGCDCGWHALRTKLGLGTGRDSSQAPEPTAPPWVRSVSVAAIEAQRAAGWPDFHPEDFCHRCGHRNPIWHAEAQAWYDATGMTVPGDGGGIMCPNCFTEAYLNAHPGERVLFWVTPKFSIAGGDWQSDDDDALNETLGADDA